MTTISQGDAEALVGRFNLIENKFAAIEGKSRAYLYSVLILALGLWWALRTPKAKMRA